MKLEVRNGGFTYPKAQKPTLTNINFSVDSGKIMTILGKNGIGKTTLVKCLAGILSWSSGVVVADGVEMTSVRKLKNIAFVPQTHSLPYSYTVKDLVLMGRARHMGLLSIPSKKDIDIAQAVIDELNLGPLADRRCHELSGGQLQMVFIARALAGEPDVVIMDEPESHLDFKNQFFILDLIEKLSKKHGLSCIINTHYPDHALRISDQTLLLGSNRSAFGETKKMITSEYIHSFLDVDAKIADVEHGGKTYQSFVVLDSFSGNE